MLAQDETDVMLFPPLRAAWAQRGQQARVVLRVLRYLRRVTPREALRKAGVLSPQFWLRTALSNHYRRPT